MPYELSWLLPNRVMVVRPYGSVTLDDLQAMDTETATAVANGVPPVHGIVNLQDVTSVPLSVKTMTRIFSEVHPNAGATVMISDNPVYRFLVNVVVQLNRAEMYTAPSQAAAIETLRRLDQTLAEMISE